MKRSFAAAVVIVASLVLTGLVLAWLTLPSFSTAEIKQAVERDTGRTVTHAGRARLSLWPELAIELKDVELSNPAGIFEGRFAAAEAVRLKISASSLWRQDLEVSEIVIVRPRVNLVVDSDGRSNFAFHSDDQSGTGAQALPPIVIVGGDVRYLNERSSAAFAASDVDVTLSRASLDGPLELTGAFNWNDQRSNIALYARSPARLTADGSPADFTMTSPHMNVAFNGRAALKNGLELAGTVDFHAGSLAGLLSWVGVATARTQAFAPLSASGALDLSGGAMRIKDGQIGFGRMKAQGDVAVSFAGQRPHIAANLGVDRIDLDLFAADLPGDAAGSAAQWSDTPVGIEFLDVLDAELSLAVSQIAYGTLVAGRSRLDVALSDGSLDATLAAMELYGGSASGRIRLAGSGAVASLSASLRAEAVDGGRLVAGLFGPDRIRGKADLRFDLSARGRSQLELVAMLKGQARVRFGKGALTELDVPAMLGHLATGVAEGWAAAAPGETPFAGLEASFTVEDGIAETADLSLRGPVAELSGAGSIDVLRQRLDLKVQPQVVEPKPGVDAKDRPATWPVAVVIEGPWSAPMIYPDVEGILEDPERAYEQLAKLIEAQAAELDFDPENLENDPDDAAATR